MKKSILIVVGAMLLAGAASAGTYTVVFDANGGSAYNEGGFTVTNQTIECGTATRLLASVFERGDLAEGYVFTGWSETEEGEVKYTNCAKVTDLAAEGGTKTLYAVWQLRSDRAAGVPTEKRLFAGKWNSVGTSITWYNDNVSYAGGRFERGYQDRVRDKFIVASFLNTGISGGCVNGANVQPADFYTLEHGINDWGNNVASGTLDDYINKTANNSFAYYYRVAIDKMKANSPKAIVLMTPRKGIGFSGYLPDRWDLQRSGGYYLQDYVNLVLDIAEYEGFEVADNFTFAGDQSTLADLSIEVALHPNDDGYQLMANEIYRAICRAMPDMEKIEDHGVYMWTKGESGTWTDSDEGWETRAAIEIPSAAEITLEGAKETAAIYVNADTTLKGDAISFYYPGRIVFNKDAVLTIESEIGEGWSITTAAGSDDVASGTVAFSGVPTAPINVDFGEALLKGENLQITSDLTLTTSGTGRIRLAEDATATIDLEGKEIEFAISGKAATKANTYNCLTDGAGATRVLGGGELSIGATLGTWGPCGKGGDIHIEKGGVVKLTSSSSMGIYKPTWVEGGTLENDYNGWGNLLYKVHVSNGAHLTGYKMETGNNDYYTGGDTDQYSGSFIWQTGDEKSLVDFDEIRLGASTDATTNPVQLRFICDGPLEVASRLTTKDASAIKVNDPTMFGFLKKGAGTLTLSSAETTAPNASFVMQAGTVAFPATAKAEFGVLAVNGAVTIDLAEGAAISFADSSATEWAGTITLTRTPKTGELRFGTSSEGITEAQLAAITVKDGTELLMIDDDGYVCAVPGATVTTRVATNEATSILMGTKQLMFSDTLLADVTGIAGDYYLLHVDARKAGNDPTKFELSEICAEGAGTAGIYHYANDGASLTCQFHAKAPYLAVVKLELTQEGDDIYGQVVYSLYPYTSTIGFDADTAASGTLAADYKPLHDDLTSSTSWMAVSLDNVRLTVKEVTYDDVNVTITYVGKDGETIQSVEAAAGYLDLAAIAPEPPEYEGYLFTGWDKSSQRVSTDITVTAVYEKQFKVVFLDADGTVLASEWVRKGETATVPDMTGKTYEGGTFRGWSASVGEVTEDMTVTAVYSAAGVPAAVTAALDSAYYPAGVGALVWGGGETGVWDDSTQNWYTESGIVTAWVAGSIAVFANDAEIAVSGAKNVAEVLNVADASRVVFTGDALNFTSGDTVRFGANGVFRFENEITGTSGYTQAMGESSSAVQKMEEPVYLVSTEARKVFEKTVKLANIETFSLMVQGYWGGAQTPVKITNEEVSKQSGIYNWMYDDETRSVTFILKYKVIDGYNVIIDAVKVKLEETDDGVYASAIYCKNALGSYDLSHGESTTWDCDFDTYSFRSDCKLCDEGVSLSNYQLHVYDFQCSLAGAVPSSMGVEVAGDCAITGEYTLDNGTFKTVDEGTLGGGAFSQAVTANAGTTFELGGTAAIEVKGKIANSGSGKIIFSGENIKLTANNEHDWELDISGKVYASGYRSLPTGGSGTKVLLGGELSVANMLSYWGPSSNNGPIEIYEGGLVRLVHREAMGVSKPWYVYGGAIANENSDTAYPIVFKLYLQDGATFTGSRVGVGFKDYYDSWSFINVSGAKPSSFAAKDIMVGYQYPASTANHKIGIKFEVADVTGDEEVDFTLDSPIVDREGVDLYSGDGLRENCGVWKTGAGTMLMTAADNAETLGVFKIDAGAVKFAATAGGKLGALKVDGDAELKFEKDARIEFADSSEIDWTDGAVLRFSGELGSKSVRIGTDANSLTPAQLQQLKRVTSNGTLKSVEIDDDGYLKLGEGFAIRFR